MAIDFEAEGLLQGVDDPAEREARLSLLGQLESEGCTAEELKRAAADGRLALLPVERVLGGTGRRYSANEIADMTGLGRDYLDQVWRALGLALSDADAQDFGELEFEGARQVK